MKLKVFNLSGLHIFILCFAVVMFTQNIAFADSFKSGIDAYNQGNYSIAEKYFRNALTGKPANPNIRYYLAITLVKNKKYNEAREQYSHIVITAPNTEAAYMANQGLAALRRIVDNLSPIKVVMDITDHDRAIIVENVKITNRNSRITTDYIFDTGASWTTMSPDLAEKLGISTLNSTTVTAMTANGVITAPKVIVDSIEVNGLVARNVEVVIQDVGAHNGASGLLGLSFLNKFKVIIDKKNNKLILEKI